MSPGKSGRGLPLVPRLHVGVPSTVEVVHLALSVHPPPGGAQSAAALLGREHPLARAEERLGRLRRQAVAVTLELLTSTTVLLADVEHLRPAVIAAGAVLAVLVAQLVVAAAAVRDRAVEMIAHGSEALPLPAVQRERARLGDPRRVRDLARSLDALRRDARTLHWLAPLYAPEVIRAVDAEIDQIVVLLRSGLAPPTALARTERLLGGAASPLYGTDVRRLRAELQRIACALV